MAWARGRYDAEEIKALIGRYEELIELRDTTPLGLRYLVIVADIDKALEQLPQDWWEVVLLHGLIGVPQAETGRLLQISHQAVSKRYRRAIEELEYLMNGGE